MLEASRRYAKNTDWYQPLDNSPSAWTMLKHLGLLLWQRLCKSFQKVETPPVLDRKGVKKGVKKKPSRRFETALKRFPLRKPLSLAIYTQRLTHLNPYDTALLCAEDEADLPSTVLPVEESLALVEEPSVEVLWELPSKASEPTKLSRPFPPTSLDSMEDINTWILLNIEDEAEEGVAESSSEPDAFVLMTKRPTTSVSSSQARHLQQEVEKTQASIDALVNAYFSQTL